MVIGPPAQRHSYMLAIGGTGASAGAGAWRAGSGFGEELHDAQTISDKAITRRSMSPLEFQNRFDFDTRSQRELRHADCGTGVHSGRAEDIHEELRGAVDHQVLVG